VRDLALSRRRIERVKYVGVWQKGAGGVWRISEDIWNANSGT